MLQRTLEHRFVQHAPQPLEPGVLYVSIDFATAMHLCCCGCSREVVTPFSPNDWKLIFDGETVSLTPSIGNWNFPCRSHYLIRQNEVIEAGPWSDQMVQTERRRDKVAKSRYYTTIQKTVRAEPLSTSYCNFSRKNKLWNRIRRWWSNDSRQED